MVVKRQCSFCADEIEPGTGTMFVKRDGTIFHFCSSSCRKQQLHLGRVGHRLKWTRAHAQKVAAEQSHATAAKNAAVAAAQSPKPASKSERNRPAVPASASPPATAGSAPSPTPPTDVAPEAAARAEAKGPDAPATPKPKAKPKTSKSKAADAKPSKPA
jgi:large subunit ribosomal protein L24e